MTHRALAVKSLLFTVNHYVFKSLEKLVYIRLLAPLSLNGNDVRSYLNTRGRNNVGNRCDQNVTFEYNFQKSVYHHFLRARPLLILWTHICWGAGVPSRRKGKNQKSMEHRILTEQAFRRCGTCSVFEGRGKGWGVTIPVSAEPRVEPTL